jgi:hypothetical protein
MKKRTKLARAELRSLRRRSGRKPLNCSGLTHEKLERVLELSGLRGFDEVLYELADAELQRRGKK